MRIDFKTLIFAFFLIVAGHALADGQTLAEKNGFSSEISFCNLANLDLAQATQCDYQKLRKNTHSGFYESPIWVRLQVKSAEQSTHAMAIHVGPHFLSDIRLFEKKDKRWVNQEAGSHLPASDSHAEIGGYTFIVQTQAADVNTYYLRINASSLSNIFIVAEPWPTTNPYNHKLGIGMQFGALLLILAFALLSHWLNPGQVMLRFSLLMLVIVLSLATGSGMLAHFVLTDSPAINQFILSLLTCLRLALWIGLAHALLKPYQTPNWYIHSCHATYAIVALGMLLIALNLQAIAFSMVLAAMLIAPVVQMVAITKTRDIEPSFKRAMLGGFLIQTLLIGILALAVRYSLAGSYLPIYLARMTDFIAPLVLLCIILYQQRLKNAELNQVKVALLESDLRHKFEQKQLTERSLLIDMLTHELKNPLSAIGMASDSLSHDLKKLGITENRRLENIKLSIANMDRIIERCVLMNAVDRQEKAFSNESLDLRALLARCFAHFDQSDRLQLSMDAQLTLKTDAYLLEIAINNLIGNALKYSPANSPVEIKVQLHSIPSPKRILITICNQIKPELAPDEAALFKRFYRHPLAHKVSGSGLGLYLTRGICQLLGASISYTKKGFAVEFTIELRG